MSQKVAEIITDKLVAMLEQGTAPWQKTWSNGSGLGSHRNLKTGSKYRGINAIMTGASGYASPYWVTLRQANELGGKVKKGEKGTSVIYLGKTEATEDKAAYSFLKYYTVFNLDQTEGLAAPVTEAPREFQPIQACADLVAKTQVRSPISHGGDRAFYRPLTDSIQMPAPESFKTPEAYYATLFHELSHATGHASRLSRDSLTTVAAFGSHEYSKEELVAEMSAAFLCGETGIEAATLQNQAAYLQGWIRVLKGDPKMAISAAAQAQKAADYIMNR